MGVILGAFGAHWLENSVQDWGLPVEEQESRLQTWEVAVRYQMYHALAILGIGMMTARRPSRSLNVAGTLFLVAVLIFSGCLYALVLSGVKVLGAIVPIGGASMIAGWVAMAVAAARLRKAPASRASDR